MAVQEPTTNTQDRVRHTIRAVMAAKEIRGPELALRLGMSSQHLYNRLNGRTAITVNDIGAIADALDTPVEAFFDGRVTIRCYSHFAPLRVV